MSTDYTLVIHGGAGEEMMLNTDVNGVIEFALHTALTLGSQVFQQGGRSLDAVQKSVEALEDCFLFNAGKGSVFNKDGKNEMEATIVDGNTMRSGSVACVQNVKNPIKAARCVMEKSSHSLIVGDGAEEFLQGLEEKEKPVGPEYFYTDIRLLIHGKTLSLTPHWPSRASGIATCSRFKTLSSTAQWNISTVPASTPTL
uniref:Isoaspartyl peptidase/L-asparaginase n=1 Tax=Sander lucioperca TaxID=283035 RepID=A0A8C9Y0H1_SANLU